MRNRLDVLVNVHGGGFTGQGGAICQGIARALKDMFGADRSSGRRRRSVPSLPAAWPRSSAIPAT